MKKTAATILMIMVIVLAMTAAPFAADMHICETSAAENEDKVTDADTVSVIFTHDMHSHMDADKAEKNGRAVEVAGFGKLKTAVNDIKEQYPESFLLDAGDFSMGTPYQTVFSKEASELKMMKYLGFEATTFGNHEFDYRATGLASMLDAAAGNGPQLVAANIDWEASLADEELKADAAVLKAACDAYGVKDYTVIRHGDVKAAVFGLIGENAVDYAPESGLVFKDAIETAGKVVETIKKNEDCDIIICLSHCGTIENESDELEETEDYRLAEEVPDIDLIISGHSHTELDEPVVVGSTYIASSGCYNKNVGHVVLERAGSGGDKSSGEQDSSVGNNGNGSSNEKHSKGNDDYELVSYKLIPLDENIEKDEATEAELEKYRRLVNAEYFNDYGYDTDQVIAINDIDFPVIDEFGGEQGEEPLGNLIADSYKYAVKEATGESVDIAIVPHGVIRGSFMKGNITVADAFNVSSLGYGKDGQAGYPLVKAYLTGAELKAVAEVDASVSNFMGVARLYSSGLEYSWNPHRLILNRAVDVKYNPGTESKTSSEIEDDRLYSVTADLYSCQMLGTVKDQSFGLLKIEPKDEDGNIITDFEDHIIYDGDRELKAWYALASYIDSFDGDRIPEYYGATHDRKILMDSRNPVELFKQLNKIAGIVAGVIAVIVLIIVCIVMLIRRHRRKKKIVQS